MLMKICRTCRTKKFITAFTTDNRNIDALNRNCKECVAEVNRKSYQLKKAKASV